MAVLAVKIRHIAPGDWEAVVTLGKPGQTACPDDPTLSISSGEGLELPPRVGDVLIVRPPEVLGYAAAINAKSSGRDG